MLQKLCLGFVVVGCLCLVNFATGDLVKAVIRNASTAKGKDLKEITCKDEKTHCPSNYTCCKATGEVYGCCDLPKAVCCGDGKSCCPESYKCDLEHRRCYPGQDGSPVPVRTLTTQQNKKIVSSKIKISQDKVTCPDKVSYCPSDTTCCKIPTGQYGCCPLPEAVCCGDGIHCCPSGSKCNLAAGTCNTAVEVVSMQSIAPTQDLTAAVKCKDGSECWDLTTCCLLKTGHFGCCPFTNAICCDDKIHCCPEGYECTGTNGTCHKLNERLSSPMIKVAVKVSDIICPDGDSRCPTGTTCCKISPGQYGCCPLPDAVCCNDGQHCCPQGYTCDVSAGTCSKKGEMLLKAFKKFAAEASDVLCPDGSSRCPTGTTCCKLAGVQVYGCCPFPQAVCCADGLHCCPQGYTCDVTAGTCSKKEVIMKTLEKLPAKASDVICPDGSSQCPAGTTCCKLAGEQAYGCCPFVHAVCCSDGLHCCQEGYTCDLSAGTCNKKGAMVVNALEKLSAKAPNLICSDGTPCPAGTTCCKLSSGGYGCCPYPNAVCCSDGEHCCPQGYTCDISRLLPTCRAPMPNLICPDGTSSCPTGTTCCKLSSGGYGCCPYPNAVCCNDGEHCCPQGYTCDVAQGTCTKKGEITVTALEKLPVKVPNLICPDGTSSCPTETTCCKLSSGGYGCCPYPNAVCCNDGEHCCPQGYTCDVAQGTCTKKGEITVTALEKLPAKVPNLICPDGTSSCPTETTCCKLSSGGYGCCPYPNAVCCNDGEHCCPQGYTCDVAQGTCTKKGELSVTALEKLPTKVPNLTCPDGTSSCPTGTTCCKLLTGGYGCCPYPNAVCCNDGEHCCPQGYTCDVAQGTCTKKGEIPVTALKKLPAIVPNLTCPDGTSSCPTGTTCCKLSSGGYGCCPYPNAVCCNDGEHCCPQGYTCDVAQGTCTKKGESPVTALEKLSAKVPNIICPDGTSSCPTGTTCCKLSSGGYGCCPFPNAVCCSDGVHCCPQGYTCDVAQGTCTKKGELSVTALEKLPTKVPNLTCPDGTSSCPTGTTCCKLSSGGYGCCPYPNAVCCNDGEHCCPQGYTCDVSQGTCTKKGEIPMKALEKLPAKDLNNLCPDGRSQCPTATTCCKLAVSGYGCCPHLDAVCCSDGIHCCPNGYTCSGGFCSQLGSVTIGATLRLPAKDTFSEFLPLKPSKMSLKGIMQNLFGNRAGDNCVMCPDDSECPNFNTCCQLADGKYGCCGFPSAVCCSDHTHCCKHGFVCDSKHNLCIQEGLKEPMMKMRFTGRDEFKVESSQSFDEM